MPPPRALPILALAALISAGCSSQSESQSPPAPTARTPPAPAATPAPPAANHALHNLHKLNETILSSAVPEGDAAFDALASLGIKTIISVDGATPDVAAAEARGIRYVHIPVTYATITDDQQLHIARAIRDLPGPILIHCHHGKHRGTAAAAAAAIALGQMTPEEGTAFLKAAGTAPNYTGLYACIADAAPASAAALDASPDDFPSIHQAHGIVAAMVEIDLASENLSAIKAASWQTPADHPDLIPAAEAGRLTDNLRLTAEDPQAAADHGEDFSRLLLDSIAKASDLEELLVTSAPAADLDAAYQRLQASCKSCHAKFRDQ